MKYFKTAKALESLPYHHLSDGTFRNLPGSPKRQISSSHSSMNFFRFFYKGIIKREMFDQKEIPDNIPNDHIFAKEKALEEFQANTDTISITWLGHAAFIIKLGNENILTDPFLSKTAGPFGIGPNRYVPAGINVYDLPEINTILVSHNHYDHLDTTTLRKIKNKKNISVICPLELSKIFTSLGYIKVIELDWFDENKNNNFNVTAVPAYHWSRRLGQKYNSTLWNGYAINYQSKKIYFSGDTAYGPMFSKIGEKLGPFDLSIISIGAYEPRGMMQASHCTPEEAVEITSMLTSKNILGMHWGTIRLSAEDPWEPPIKFREAAQKKGYQEDQIWQLSIGETKSLI
jgi:L-ascorbate metabolism protein UlaG (beta-lactamase superfamily)